MSVSYLRRGERHGLGQALGDARGELLEDGQEVLHVAIMGDESVGNR